jgi:hypothetical protein
MIMFWTNSIRLVRAESIFAPQHAKTPSQNSPTPRHGRLLVTHTPFTSKASATDHDPIPLPRMRSVNTPLPISPFRNHATFVRSENNTSMSPS